MFADCVILTLLRNFVGTAPYVMLGFVQMMTLDGIVDLKQRLKES